MNEKVYNTIFQNILTQRRRGAKLLLDMLSLFIQYPYSESKISYITKIYRTRTLRPRTKGSMRALPSVLWRDVFCKYLVFTSTIGLYKCILF